MDDRSNASLAEREGERTSIQHPGAGSSGAGRDKLEWTTCPVIAREGSASLPSVHINECPRALATTIAGNLKRTGTIGIAGSRTSERLGAIVRLPLHWQGHRASGEQRKGGYSRDKCFHVSGNHLSELGESDLLSAFKKSSDLMQQRASTRLRGCLARIPVASIGLVMHYLTR